MINVSDDVKKLYASDVLPGTITLVINGSSVDSSEWISGSLTITETLCSKDTLDYSSVESNVLEVELASEKGNKAGLKGETVEAKQTINGETIPLGVFTIAETTLDGDYFTKVKAYDGMKKFIDSDITDWWNSKVKFPITVHDLLIALCAQVGVATNLPDTWTNSTVSVKQTAYVDSLKASDLLGMIQETCGLFFHTNRQNKLAIVQSSSKETAIPYTDLFEDAKVSDYTVPAITGVQIKATDKDTGGFYGDKAYVYQITGNYLLMGKEEYELQDIAKNVLANIGNRSYKPFSAKVKARNYVEVGDPVRITTYKGTTTAAPLLSRKMSDDGLITDEIAVKGKPDTVNNPRSNRKILQVYSQKMHEVEETLDGYKSSFEEIKTTQTELGKSLSAAKSEWQQTANGISQTVSSNYDRTVIGQHEEFAQGDSDTTAPTTGWSTTQPERVNGKYIWRRMVTSFGDGTTSTSPGVCITGAKGDKGDTGSQGPAGAKGADGKDGHTPVVAATKSGDTTTITVDGKAQATIKDGAKGDKGATGPQGLQGLQGPKGDQGVPGKDGATGKTSYFHIKYSSVASPTSSSQMSETPSTYIGTYVDFTEADSTDPTKYTWSQFKGSQGAKGDQGIAGKNGTDGKTSYLHIAYATSADGSTGFSTSDSTGKTYIGQYADFVSADSTDHTKYAWTLIKGDKGATGATGPQGPQGLKGDQGIPGKAGADGKTPYLHMAYANSADGKTNFNVNYFSGALYVGTYTDYTQADSTSYSAYTWARLKGDTGATGQKGATGATGPKALQPTRNWNGTFTTIGQTTGCGTSDFNRTPVVNDTFTNLDGSSNIGTWQVTAVSGTSVTIKLLSYVNSKGADGKGIKSTAITYQASGSQTVAPTGTWSSSVPSLSASSPYLWTRTVITYTDNTTSTSYSVGSTLEGVNIGGRNYAPGTSKEWSEYWIPTTGTNIVLDICSVSVPNTFKAGAVFTTTIEVEWSNFSASGGTFAILAQGAQDEKWAVNNVFTDNLLRIESASGSKVFTVTNTWLGNATNYHIGFRCDHSSGSGKLRWRRLKVESGNKATDWTPAPEDVDARIDSAIVKHEQEYYRSTSDTSLAGGSWSTTFPPRKDGTVYWVRYKDTHANGAVTYDPSANGKLLTEANEVWNTVVSNKTAINSSNAQINLVATSVTSVKNDLNKKANSDDVKSSMDGLSSTIADINKQVAELKVKANSIEASVTDVNNLAQTTKKATAALTTDGLLVDTGQTTKSVVDGTGLTITSKADNSVVAKFTTGESEIQNLKIDGYMKLGAHTIQKMQDTEWDGTTVNGTGWMWNGG